ncbi:MAG: replicative DNA helicase [Pseudomonadota bacterium]
MSKSTAIVAETPAGKIPVPHSLEAEQCLLGAVMINQRLFDEVESILRPEHFYYQFNGAVYRTIGQLIAEGIQVSPLTVRDHLHDRAKFEAAASDKHVDLLNNLVTLVENAIQSADMTALAETIRNAYRNRCLMDIGSELFAGIGKLVRQETDQHIAKIESLLFEVGQGAVFGIESSSWRDVVKQSVIDAYEADKKGKPLRGVPSGWDGLDKLTSGFQPSDLIILAGRPGMGKTAFAMNLAVNVSEARLEGREGGCKVGVFSLEMSKEQLADRVIAGMAEVDSHGMRSGQLHTTALDRVAEISSRVSDLDLVVDDASGLDIVDIRSRARRMVRRDNVGLIIIDYIQLLSANVEKPGENRVQEISHITRSLKALGRELNVPIIALSQLSREVEKRENKRPILADLRESGSIEQDADLVMFLFREEVYERQKCEKGGKLSPEQQEVLMRLKGVTELELAKHRHGRIGRVHLIFDERSTKFHSAVSGDTAAIRVA